MKKLSSSPIALLSVAAITAIVAMIAGCEPGNNNPGGGDKFAMYTLTTGVTPANSGTVDRDPYTTTYQNGTEVTLTAKPAAGYRFTGWSDTSLLQMATLTITMKRDTVLTAIFEQIPEDRYTLSINASPIGGGTVSRNPDSTSYAPGTLVEVRAIPDENYRFTGWTGASTDTTGTITVTMNANLTLTANFERIRFPLNIQIAPPDGGTVLRGNGATDTTTYEVGAKVTVTARANTGFTFNGWSGAATSTDTVVTVTISSEQPQILTANFRQITYHTLSVNIKPVGGGTVTRDPSLTNYPAGTPVKVTATPTAGYLFSGWTGVLTSANLVVTVTMNTDLTLNANFQPEATMSGDILTDNRDGQKYRTVVIGGKRWMAENLNYTTTNFSWCHDNNASNCTKYGRLYTWDAARRACPAGWRLPARDDWDDLVRTAGGSDLAGGKLKSKTGWDFEGTSYSGTDEFGFSALPGGCRYYNDGTQYSDKFFSVGVIGYWWSAATESGSNAYSLSMNLNANVSGGDSNKGFGYSVRCLQDQ